MQMDYQVINIFYYSDNGIYNIVPDDLLGPIDCTATSEEQLRARMYDVVYPRLENLGIDLNFTRVIDQRLPDLV